MSASLVSFVFLQQSPPIAPVSLSGWVSLVISLSIFVLLLFDRVTGRGRSLARVDAKLDRLCEDMTEAKATSKVMDAHLDTISDSTGRMAYELKILNGQTQRNTTDIKEVQLRNSKMDPLAERVQRHLERDEEERREILRRLGDRERKGRGEA
jgi:hypothetical protein